MNISDYSPKALDALWDTVDSYFESPKKTTLCPICEKNPAAEPHTCPFKEETHEDAETLCTCCKDCTHQCAQDI